MPIRNFPAFEQDGGDDGAELDIPPRHWRGRQEFEDPANRVASSPTDKTMLRIMSSVAPKG
jgi:hypothetical protein